MARPVSVVLPYPSTRLETYRRTTVEHAEDAEVDHSFLPSPANSSPSSSAFSSRTSTLTTDDEDDAEEIVRSVHALSLRDCAHDVALNPWSLTPPRNFGTVLHGIYRSSYPKPENLGFLKLLGLRSILTLVSGDLPEANRRFIDDNGVAHYQISIEPNKDPFVTISQCNMTAALGVVLNRENHPLLIHCNKGKHRTGTVVGCLRKIQGWGLADIFAEYATYAGPKARLLDERFIELFDERALLWLARSNSLLKSDEPVRDSPLVAAAVVGARLRT